MASEVFKKLPAKALEAVALRFRALGEPSRLRIIQALQVGEMNVTELVKATGLTQPNVSRHLSILATAGLIARRKEGLNVMYSILDANLNQICLIVCRSVSGVPRS